MVDWKKVIMELTIIVILIVIPILILLGLLKPALNRTKSVLIVFSSSNFSYDDFPCLYACYTSPEGTELELLQGYFTKVRGSSVLIDYFACNNELTKIATMINELARWSVQISEGELIPLPRTGDVYQTAKVILYNCLSKGTTGPLACDDLAKASYFCELDSYLEGFPFFPCYSDSTLDDFINPVRSIYDYRPGVDINNDFVCTEEGKTYDLCAPGPDVDYTRYYSDDDSCRPAWVTLKGFNEGGFSGGRCEDFAILYYSLFRAIGVPAKELSVSINYCDLPCPCKLLVDNITSLAYEELECVYPANVSIFNASGSGDWEVIEACSLVYNQEDIVHEARLKIYAEDDNYTYTWIVNQSEFGVNNAFFVRKLIFDRIPPSTTSPTKINSTLFSYKINDESPAVNYHIFDDEMLLMPDDYTHYWDFNEGIGIIAYDKSIDDADLLATSQPPWEYGKLNFGTRLDGTADCWISTDLTSITDDTAGSISVWFKQDNDDDSEHVFSLSNESTDSLTYLSILPRTSAGLVAYVDVVLTIDGAEQWHWQTAPGSTLSGEWHHLVIVQDGVSPLVYVDEVVSGNLVNDTYKTKWIADLTGATNPAGTVTIGAYSNNGGVSNHFNGSIDELMIYSRALTIGELTGEFMSVMNFNYYSEEDSCSYLYNGNKTACDLYKHHLELELGTSDETVIRDYLAEVCSLYIISSEQELIGDGPGVPYSLTDFLANVLGS